jgi:hypothetical protein
VGYGLNHRIVTFRGAHGTKLSYTPGSPAAFEIDDFALSTRVGRSVLVQGVAVDATTALDQVAWIARRATPHPLAPGRKSIVWR